MSKFNNDVIQAQEVVENYKKYNQQTKEVFSHYDPVLKIRVFKKVAIDPQAEIFKKKFIGKRREKKEDPEKKKPGRLKAVKQKTATSPIIKPVALPQPKPAPVMSQKLINRIAAVKSMYVLGKTREEMAASLSTSENNITRALSHLGLKANFKRKLKPGEILKDIQNFCRKNKINLFYTAYNTMYKVSEADQRLLRYTYNILVSTRKLEVIREKCGTKLGNCYRVFSKPTYSEERLPILCEQDKMVLKLIQDFCNEKRQNFFFGNGIPDLMQRTGFTRSKVEHHLNKLTNEGYIEKQPKHVRGKINIYRVFSKKNFSENTSTSKLFKNKK